ncbi:MAG TPA: chloride channel protein [Solirubrobacteraceae bacterium]|nr:chloride channel protein [Solirubrobacteraceae bacterium]
MEAGSQAAGRAFLRLVLLGALVGIPAGLIGALFLALVHELESWLWDDPTPWYLIVGLPVAGAVIVIAARALLPGDGGHRPLDGLSTELMPISYAPGIALAAIGTLAFGAVLGPEAPVIALGSITAVAVTGFARLGPQETKVIGGAGSFSAISALFGGPLVAGVMMMEAGVGLGARLIPTLLPGFVAAAVGYLIFVGFGDWGGLDTPGLTVPDLAPYQGTHLLDLLVAIAVGVLTALAIVVIHRFTHDVAERAEQRRTMPVLLLAGGLAVGLLALLADALGADANEILFSGQSAIPELIHEQTTSVLLLILAAKAAAYAVTLASGFRGGPIFPAVFLGIGIATLPVVWFDVSPTLAIAVGAAAGMAAQTRFALTSMLFGALLVGSSGLDAVPAAVLATVAAWLTATALDARPRRGSRASGARPSEQSATARSRVPR